MLLEKNNFAYHRSQLCTVPWIPKINKKVQFYSLRLTAYMLAVALPGKRSVCICVDVPLHCQRKTKGCSQDDCYPFSGRIKPFFPMAWFTLVLILHHYPSVNFIKERSSCTMESRQFSVLDATILCVPNWLTRMIRIKFTLLFPFIYFI